MVKWEIRNLLCQVTVRNDNKKKALIQFDLHHFFNKTTIVMWESSKGKHFLIFILKKSHHVKTISTDFSSNANFKIGIIFLVLYHIKNNGVAEKLKVSNFLSDSLIMSNLVYSFKCDICYGVAM